MNTHTVWFNNCPRRPQFHISAPRTCTALPGHNYPPTPKGLAKANQAAAKLDAGRRND